MSWDNTTPYGPIKRTLLWKRETRRWKSSLTHFVESMPLEKSEYSESRFRWMWSETLLWSSEQEGWIGNVQLDSDKSNFQDLFPNHPNGSVQLSIQRPQITSWDIQNKWPDEVLDSQNCKILICWRKISPTPRPPNVTSCQNKESTQKLWGFCSLPVYQSYY